MPAKRANCANPILYDILMELRDAEESESHRYKNYNRAAKNMKAYPHLLRTPDEALEVPSIGPKTVSELKKRMGSGLTAASSNGEGPSARAAKKSAGRPKKSDSMADISVANVNSSSNTLPNQAPVHVNGDEFPFCYLSYDSDAKEVRVVRRSEAHMEVELPSGPGFFIEYPRSCRHPVANEISTKISQPNRVIGYLPLHIAEDYFPESTLRFDWLTLPAVSLPLGEAGPSKLSATDIIAAENVRERKKQKGGGLDPSRQQSTAGRWTISTSGSSAAILQRSQTMPQSVPQPVRASGPSIASSSQPTIRHTDSAPATTHSVGSQSRKKARPRLSHAIAPPPAVEIDIDIEDPYASTDRVEFPAFSPCVIRSYEYDVVLLLDTREVKSGANRNGIFDRLRRQNVNVEQRALNIGDVCWIAKRKPEYRDGSEYDEITLDSILERKRLDDLVESIKDGRFHDQKFRLHNTAITKVYYLVEEYTLKEEVCTEQDKSTFGKAIETAISQTGIIDRFMVKETKSINDTINWYEKLHQQVVLSYQHKDLYVIPSNLVKRYSYLKFQKELRRQNPERSHLLPYRTFSHLNLKSGFVTVRETWARMLLCIHGVSAEKAGVLIQQFPTPDSMYLACIRAKERQQEEDEGEMDNLSRGGKPRKKKDTFIAAEFLKDYGGHTDRRIGPALSRKIFDVMMLFEYPQAEDDEPAFVDNDT